MPGVKRPKVTVCVVAYNHEKYIDQCLQSLVDQKTNFDFDIIVADDCSVDSTRSIIQNFATRYPQRVKPVFNSKNLGPFENYLSVHAHASGDYIAHMDGDDYALPGKLQAQADQLDRDPDCAIVWHRVKVLDGKTGQIQDDLVDVEKIPTAGFSREEILALGSVACHSSKMYRAAHRLIGPLPAQFLDFLTDIEHLANGNGRYLKEFYGVYRANVGISSDSYKTRKILIANLDFLGRRFPESRRPISAHLLRLALGDLINRRPTFINSFRCWLRLMHPLCFWDVVASRKRLKMFRSPL